MRYHDKPRLLSANGEAYLAQKMLDAHMEWVGASAVLSFLIQQRPTDTADFFGIVPNSQLEQMIPKARSAVDEAYARRAAIAALIAGFAGGLEASVPGADLADTAAV